MEQPLPQCWSTNSVLRAFFPRVAIGCRLSLKIDQNLSPSLAGTLSVATWYDSAWIRGTASGTLYRSVVAAKFKLLASTTTSVITRIRRLSGRTIQLPHKMASTTLLAKLTSLTCKPNTRRRILDACANVVTVAHLYGPSKGRHLLCSSFYIPDAYPYAPGRWRRGLRKFQLR